MKKLLSLLMCGLLLFGCGDKYDDSALRNDLNDLENRVTKLEELCKQMNTNISSLQKIVDALQDDLSISKVEQISDGYIIHFSDGSTATIKNGKDSGTIPIIGVKQDIDGCYYWTLDGEWLTDEKGNKVKAQGTDGKDGVDGEDGNDGADGEDGTDGTNGKDGITPQLKIENGRWMLSMDDGKTWTDIGQATGADGTDGKDGVDGKDGTNGIFKSVTEDDNNVYFTLEDDSVITIPKSDNSKFAIVFDTTDVAILNGGESKTISYMIEGATENTVVKAIAQDGWKVKVNATSTDKGTITITAPNPIVESEILVFANNGSYRTVMVSLNCMQGQINIADNSIDATPAGGTQEIKLTTNLDYTVEIPDNAKSWLSLAPETRAMREDTIVFEVAANEGIQRYTTIALRDEQGNILQTIIFRQLGTCTEIHVETKGELENELAGYDYANIESLKITGMLNDVDFLFIYRMMPKLKDLDIAEVNITALPKQAFYKSTNVENLILPNTLVTIGEEVFYQSKLKSIKISNTVNTIERAAFENCSDLIAVTIPASVTRIAPSAFRNCTSLSRVDFNAHSQLEIIDGGYKYNQYYEPDEYGAFVGCSILESITIPASVKTIGPTAFKNCSSLKLVNFEHGTTLQTIGGDSYGRYSFGCFENCSQLTTIKIPASIETIGIAAFKGCSSLSSLIFEDNSKLKLIDGAFYANLDNPYCHGAFSNCSKLLNFKVPNSLEIIGDAAFSGCVALESINFEMDSSLQMIKEYAFKECSSLRILRFPVNISSIGATAFKGCIGLEEVLFNKGAKLTEIKGNTFKGCTALKTIEIPANVEIIGSMTFQDCTSLANINFEPNSKLKVIKGGYKQDQSYRYTYHYGAFLNCSSIRSITIPASVETIESTAFRNCTSLETVIFEKGSQLKIIEGSIEGTGVVMTYPNDDGAFSGCPSLQTVDAEYCTNIESIGSSAFYQCRELRLFKIGTVTPPECYASALYGINPYSVLKVPSGCADTYRTTYGWKNFASITGLDE